MLRLASEGHFNDVPTGEDLAFEQAFVAALREVVERFRSRWFEERKGQG